MVLGTIVALVVLLVVALVAVAGYVMDASVPESDPAPPVPDDRSRHPPADVLR